MNKHQWAGTAVVVGGSMAGLLASRVLADYFDEVIIIERDELSDAATPRKGVPQGRHAHALLGNGRMIMEEFFPGLSQDLVSQGAVQGHGRFFSGGGYLHKLTNIPPGLFVTRPFLEHAVRSRVLTLPNVRVVDQCDVLGWTVEEGRITGIRMIRRQAGSVAEVLSGSLVVDASGRGSRTPAWLESLGYPKPEVDWVEVNMGYASRFYKRKPEDLDGNLVINIAPTLDNKRACGMLTQEGDRWLVTLAGYFGDYPPTDEQGYLEFARRLPTSDVYHFIRSATPLNDPVAFKFPANQRRRYEKLERFPEGLIVIGDAICSFTPIYGQGMTVAAMEAKALQEALAAGQNGFAKRYFLQVSKVVDIPWSVTVGNDMNLTEERNLRPAMDKFISWYMSKLLIAARHDPEIVLAFMKVANLFAVPSSLLNPRVALRVLLGNLRASTKESEQIYRGQKPIQI